MDQWRRGKPATPLSAPGLPPFLLVLHRREKDSDRRSKRSVLGCGGIHERSGAATDIIFCSVMILIVRLT